VGILADSSSVEALLDWRLERVPDQHEDMPMPTLTEDLQTAAAAEYLGVAQNTLRKWAGRGDIPMRRNPANGYRLFKRSDLDRFLNKAAKPVNKKT